MHRQLAGTEPRNLARTLTDLFCPFLGHPFGWPSLTGRLRPQTLLPQDPEIPQPSSHRLLRTAFPLLRSGSTKLRLMTSSGIARKRAGQNAKLFQFQGIIWAWSHPCCTPTCWHVYASSASYMGGVPQIGGTFLAVPIIKKDSGILGSMLGSFYLKKLPNEPHCHEEVRGTLSRIIAMAEQNSEQRRRRGLRRQEG